MAWSVLAALLRPFPKKMSDKSPILPYEDFGGSLLRLKGRHHVSAQWLLAGV